MFKCDYYDKCTDYEICNKKCEAYNDCEYCRNKTLCEKSIIYKNRCMNEKEDSLCM